MTDFELIDTPNFGYNVLYTGAICFVWNQRLNKYIAIEEYTGDIDVYTKTEVYRFLTDRLNAGNEIWGTDDTVYFKLVE